jgi:hypothetical protein
MDHYVGLDVSLKQTSICVVNQVGSVVREGVVDSEPEAIAAFVRSKAPGAVRVGPHDMIKEKGWCGRPHLITPILNDDRAAYPVLIRRAALATFGGRNKQRAIFASIQSDQSRCTMPVLELDDGTRVADILAICRYFERQAISSDPHLGDGPEEALKAEEVEKHLPVEC